MKRLIASFVAVLFLGLPVAQARTFSDIPGTRYQVAYDFLSNRGVVQGYSDGTGRPYSKINRVEALKVLMDVRAQYSDRARWFAAHLPATPLFRDVSQREWYAPFLETAYESGFVKGYPDRTFRPANPVTVEEAVVMLIRVYGLEPLGTQSTGPDWYKGAVALALQKNLLAKEETLYLGEPMTRGQFMDMVYRMEIVQSQFLVAFKNSDGTTTPHSPLVLRPAPVYVSVPGSSKKLALTEFYITIPSLGINNLRVTHPADTGTSKGILAPLQYGVGHLFSYPGKGGKIMIYGHSSGYAWDVSKYTKIFTQVNKLKAGDSVYVEYGGKKFTYQVIGQKTIAATDVTPFRGAGEELILYTCWPIGSATQRLIVRATPVNNVATR